MSTSVLILAYHEAENLTTLLPAIERVLDDMFEEHEVIVVDSATPTDNTAEVCAQFGASYVPQAEPNYAGAFRTGIARCRFDKIQVLDADWSHDPADIPALHAKFAEGNDLVIGSRYVPGGKTDDAGLAVLMSTLLNAVMRLCVGVRAKDLSTSMRCYDAAQLRAVTLTRQHYDVLQEVVLTMRLRRPGFTIGEVPVTFSTRLHGTSQRQLGRFIASYLRTLFFLTGLRLRHTAR
jgi:dolichol-phosphate mannosyltransferase